MDLRIEIAGEEVVCRQDGSAVLTVPLKEFVTALAERTDSSALPEAIPEGVRFLRRRGDAMVLVMEERPKVRTVRWLADESPAPFAKGAIYRMARLSFPFVLVIVVFRGGRLTGHHQCFYRTEPFEKLTDPLLYPNLYNVAEGYGQKCWLCLASLQQDLRPLSWNDKVRAIRAHLWGGAWNQSSEVHEGNSYWSTLRGIDPRLANLAAWEQATREDPYFTLQVPWKPAGETVGDVMEAMLAMAAAPAPPASAAQLIHLFQTRKNPSSRRSFAGSILAALQP